jgi:hypothetical protein
MKRKRFDAMVVFCKALDADCNLFLASNTNAFTSHSPIAGNQVHVNHLIQFQQPMSNPTNEPSNKPVRKPTNQIDLDAELPNNLSPKKT